MKDIKGFQSKFCYLTEPRKRRKTNEKQLDLLLKFFDQNPNPDAKQRKKISEVVQMDTRAIQVWFQNRRSKTRSSSKSSTRSTGSSPSSSLSDYSETSNLSEAPFPSEDVLGLHFDESILKSWEFTAFSEDQSCNLKSEIEFLTESPTLDFLDESFFDDAFPQFSSPLFQDFDPFKRD